MTPTVQFHPQGIANFLGCHCGIVKEDDETYGPYLRIEHCEYHELGREVAEVFRAIVRGERGPLGVVEAGMILDTYDLRERMP